jgi:hypothetical protein
MPVNTAALKTFAPAMRRQLLEAVGRKLDQLLHSQTPDTLSTYAKQIAELREQEAENREQLLERVAYTWFNRLCALRYLDARGWHPFGSKVLMPASQGETQPELLKLMREGNLPPELQRNTDEKRLHELLDGLIQAAIKGADPQGEVYRELVLATCRFYHKLLPNLFEELDDATELLLPDDILTDGSIAGGFRREINDEDCQDVEIIGWLYQFYISEKKDEVMGRKKAVPAEDIPAVTQLFTPHWIVRYLVENSLGRLWLLNNPDSRLREHMPYYIEGETECDFPTISTPEEIKFVDPACGSGHILTYAFELLVIIYDEKGYSIGDIPALILRNNLFGIEICPRATQLAGLALVLKARESSRRFLHHEQLVKPRIQELHQAQFKDDELSSYFSRLDVPEEQRRVLARLIPQFIDAKRAGSLINPCLDTDCISQIQSCIEDLWNARFQRNTPELFIAKTHSDILGLLDQASLLARKYQVAVTNPPYLGSASFSAQLKLFAEANYTEGRTDLYALFISRMSQLCCRGGYVGMITMQSWLFLTSYEELRRDALTNWSFANLVHLGARAFDSLSGEVVQTAAFVLKTARSSQGHGIFLRLLDGRNEAEKEKYFRHAISDSTSSLRFSVSPELLLKIPGCPVAYWIGEGVIEAFSHGRDLEAIAPVRQGFQTGDNDRFMRLWPEVNFQRCKFDAKAKEEVFAHSKKWVPYNKGGSFRRWYGNNEYVVAFDEENYLALSRSGNCLPSRNLYFKKAITWSALASGAFGARLSPEGFTFSAKGACAFPNHDYFDLSLGLLNSAVVAKIFEFFAATLDFNVGSIRKVPLLPDEKYDTADISRIVGELVSIAKADWDSTEISWDFLAHPLLRPETTGNTLEVRWNHYMSEVDRRFCRMRELEEENNRIFISAYGLDGDLSAEVSEDHVTLSRADARKDIASLLSYVIGCMMGRYSIDQPSLILAETCESQADQLALYEQKVGKPLRDVSFKPDPDGILPVLDGEWFEDDIVARLREFLGAALPEGNITENLRFIERSLGKDVRKYLCSDFYKDHLQTYKKRPIYWMVQSPKRGFACLIYLHRYTRDTLNQVLNNYFRPYIQKLEARLTLMEQTQLKDDLLPRERAAARKEVEKITRVLNECHEWEKDALLPMAQERIEIDLDDGVKVSYSKLKAVLAPIPGITGKD